MTADGHGLSLLVTGATGGIGAATTRLALEAGHSVVALGRTPARVEALAAELGAPDRLRTAVLDVTDWEATQRAVADAVAFLGGIDVVVANAGAMAAGGIASGDPEEWRTMVLTNVLGVALTVKATLPPVTERRGRYVLVSSVVGRVALAGSLYGATKHAVSALGENLRLELCDTGVGVTVVEPGIVDTPLWPERPALSLSSEEAAQTILWAATQSSSVHVNQLLVRPAGQWL